MIPAPFTHADIARELALRIQAIRQTATRQFVGGLIEQALAAAERAHKALNDQGQPMRRDGR